MDDCIKITKGVKFSLDTAAFSKFPYKGYDTITLKLTSTGYIMPMYADEWVTGYDPQELDPCKTTEEREFRRLTFTCRVFPLTGRISDMVDGWQLIIKHYVNEDINGIDKVNITLYGKNMTHTVNKIGVPYQQDSLTIQGKTYYDINFLPTTNNDVYPFGCFYNQEFGILRIHYIDPDWPVPQGGMSFDLIRK
ncbi:MAG: hypothetical protein V4590_14595 [Bacteroidota bacterium]